MTTLDAAPELGDKVEGAPGAEFQQRVAVSIVIPAHNEAAVIGDVVARARDVCPDAEIIVVDDGSTDDTAARAREAGALVVQHPYNKGNGAAVKRGIRQALGDLIVLMDGDGQHDAADIPRLLEHFPEFDMVVGARGWRSQANWSRALANKVFSLFASYITGEHIPDLTSGLRAIKRTLAKRYAYLLPNGFSYPTTITMALLRAGYAVKYVPITATDRQGQSKLRPLSDGLRFLVIILKIGTLFEPFKVFLPVSMLCLSLGLGYGGYALFWEHRFSGLAQLLVITGLLVFMMGLIAEQIAALRMERGD